MSKIQAVAFDWGAVLIEDPAPGLVSYCAKELGVTDKQLITARNKHLIEFQKGRSTEAEFWQRVTQELNVKPPSQPSLWSEAFRTIYTPRLEIFNLIKDLKKKHYRIGFISNTEEPNREYFYELGYDKIFDEPIFSCQEGMVKPEPEIYQLLLKRLKLPAEAVAFIDDSPINTEAASALGIHAITFTSSPQAIRELTQLL